MHLHGAAPRHRIGSPADTPARNTTLRQECDASLSIGAISFSTWTASQPEAVSTNRPTSSVSFVVPRRSPHPAETCRLLVRVPLRTTWSCVWGCGYAGGALTPWSLPGGAVHLSHGLGGSEISDEDADAAVIAFLASHFLQKEVHAQTVAQSPPDSSQEDSVLRSSPTLSLFRFSLCRFKCCRRR